MVQAKNGMDGFLLLDWSTAPWAGQLHPRPATNEAGLCQDRAGNTNAIPGQNFFYCSKLFDEN